MSDQFRARASGPARFVGSLGCRLLFPDRPVAAGEVPAPITTRVISISATEMVVEAKAVVGERFVASVQDVGRVLGRVASQGHAAAVLELEADAEARKGLSAKILWLKKLHARQVKNERSVARIPQPTKPAFAYIQGREVACIIQDLSPGGVGVRLVDAAISVGAQLHLGCVPILVVRVFEGGFGARFLTAQTQDTINKVYERRRA